MIYQIEFINKALVRDNIYLINKNYYNCVYAISGNKALTFNIFKFKSQI